jgi:putative hydrolases of HD superfamily
MKNRNVDLLYELGTLRFLKRAWVQMLTPEFSNLSEHIFRVIWLSLLIAKMEKKGDHEKILKMAMVHDVSESRTGDVHFISRQYTKRDEKLAIEDILDGTELKDMIDIWREYEKKKSIEAKIVKDADNLDVDLELMEQAARGNQIEKAFREHRNKVQYNGLYTKSAKKLWKEIHSTNPYSWTLKARNRFNDGDWKHYKNKH